MTESAILGAIIRQRQPLRDELQRQVDEFHANGGVTQHFKPGETSGSDITDLGQAHKRRKDR